MRCEVGNRADAERLGTLARHHQRIGVFKTEFAEQRDLLPRQRRFQFGEQFLARPDVGVMKLVGPQRAGIVDIDVDIVGNQRIEDDAGAEPLARSGRKPRSLQPLRDQRRQHILLGKGLGADHIARRRTGQRGHQRCRDQRGDADAAQRDADAAAPAKALLDQGQQLIDRERQYRGGKAAEQHEHPVLGLQAGKDVVAEAGLADRGRQRRGADHPHRRGADARHDHRQRQRQLHGEQGLTLCHADALRGLEDGGIDAFQAGDGIAQHRQHGIERQRQHRGQEAERGKAQSEPGQRQRRQRQQQRIEQRQERQARHRLHDRGQPEQRAAQDSTIACRNREGQADQEAQRQRRDADADVVAEIIRQMSQCLAPARIGEQAHAAPSRGSSALSRSACRRGVCSSSPT